MQTDNKKEYDVNAFGLTQEEFKAYTESLKSQGFTKSLHEEVLNEGAREEFYGEDGNGTTITILIDYGRKITEINIVKS